MPFKVVKGIRTLSMAFKHGVWDGINNLALIDFSSVQTDDVHRGCPQSTVVAQCGTLSMMLEHCPRIRMCVIMGMVSKI